MNTLTFDDWVVIAELGAGGQGAVYKVRKPSRTREVNEKSQELTNLIHLAAREKSAQLVSALQTLASDPPDDLGALKKFNIPATGDEAKEAVGRLELEIKALGSLEEPGILKLLGANVEQRWMVTEYHPGGTLAQHRDRYKGDALAALKAFRPLAAAVARLHQEGMVHRDIKPDNIFVASDGRLVLGDFGIVFFQDAAATRLTTTFEKVGSTDWMAPWANLGVRLDEVNPTLDVFPLGKVLWSMISGRAMLPYWWHPEPAHNLEVLFPAVADEMGLINSLLDCCIVPKVEQCLPSAVELLPLVDEALTALQRGGRMLKEDVLRPCRVCGRGTYQPLTGNFGEQDRILMAASKQVLERYEVDYIRHPTHGQNLTVRMFACDACGHVEMFHFADGKLPAAWTATQHDKS